MEVSGIAGPLKGQKDIKKEPRKIQGNFTVDFRGHVETFLKRKNYSATSLLQPVLSAGTDERFLLLCKGSVTEKSK